MSAVGLGCVKTPGQKRRHVRISGEAPCAVVFPGLPAFVGLEVLLMGVRPSWEGLGRRTDAYRRRLCPDRRQERLDAQDVHDTRKIVGEHVQSHLGGNPWQCLHEEVGCSHPGLDRAEGMLDGFAPLAHLLRMLVEPALNRLENMLMLPSGDPPLFAGGAVVLDGAALAGVGPVAAQDQVHFLRS